ncbi:hypothetical protein ATK17_1325 [Branchiibius hedensis]|uniref:Neutral zinc metallopeptidase n=1 Tax=Branchiibius hedensis TaxID=672460 RepID=A0A2Y8ZQ20_9MICO|nr:neutral zinc metallopeptidase [Branchiibius hedensis]PWJ25211.1 hypothetical protein ATK17_1325 [Branchiibius hedensis]SSA34025.1 hypothetical protein SAMN04489750_1325 [Branchiibius hedensis]
MTFNDNVGLDTSQVQSGGSGGGYGGGGGVGRGGVAIGGIGGIIIMILTAIFGGNLLGSSGTSNALDNTSEVSSNSGSITDQFSECKTGADANSNDTCRVIATVNSVQNFWSGYLPKYGQNYTPAKTVLYSGQTQSGCGTATSDMGPFYCPLDQKVYVDVSFYQELSSKYGADTGALAKEYVIAHEYGHHIQNIFGVLGASQQDPQGANSASVRTELQADCYAGLWVRYASQTTDSQGNVYIKDITDTDIRSALSAAAAVGDDHIQAQATGRVRPDTFTHGTSAQRQKWFYTGYSTGDLNRCDTFNAASLG